MECQGTVAGPCPGHLWWYEKIKPGRPRERCPACDRANRNRKYGWREKAHPTVCAGCEGALPAPARTGRPRKWCPECAKIARAGGRK
jgi:hypothetical protein